MLSSVNATVGWVERWLSVGWQSLGCEVEVLGDEVAVMNDVREVGSFITMTRGSFSLFD